VRWGPAVVWRLVALSTAVAAASAVLSELKLHAGIGTLALLPAAVATIALLWLSLRDPRPASMAFWGVALYATVTGGLAAAYGLAAGR